jgi:metal iron transporter
MNYPSRSDNTERHPDWNQNPQSLNADATTRADLNGLVNSRELRDARSDRQSSDDPDRIEQQRSDDENGSAPPKGTVDSHVNVRRQMTVPKTSRPFLHQAKDAIIKYAQFVGPGVSEVSAERGLC